MNDLNALFDSVDGLKEDIIEYGTIGLGAYGATVAWDIAVAKLVPTTLDPTLRKWGIPAAAVLVGIFGGRMVARYNRKIGLGMTVGLVALGLSRITRNLIPGLPVGAMGGLGASEDYYGVAGYLGGPVTIEEANGMGGFSGPVTVEESNLNGFEAVLQ